MTTPIPTAGNATAAAEALALPALAEHEVLPASFAQERLWLVQEVYGGGRAYHLFRALRLHGALDAEALERALAEVVRRHEALRTTFRAEDGVPVQVIAPFRGVRLPVEDLAILDADAREAAVRARLAEEVARPFDLREGPLFRPGLLRLAEEEHVLFIAMHHVVGDGWSLDVLYRELAALYGAFREGRVPSLPPLPVQYADFALWQREELAGEALERQLAYWREHLAGAPALLELPLDHPRPAERSFRGAFEPFTVPAGVVERLEALARGEGASLFMVLLAAFQVLLSRECGSDDVVVGTPVAGRTQGEVEGLIGLFANLLPLRVRLSGDPEFRAVVRRARAATLGAVEHQALPFERLVAEVQPERSLSYAPVVQAVFSLQDVGRPGEDWPGLRVRPEETAHDAAKFDLSLEFRTVDGAMRGMMWYATDLFEPGTIRRMTGRLLGVLAQAAADPAIRLSRMEWMDEGERRRVVEEWNRTEGPPPPARSIHALFAEQAARAPDRVAVVYGAETLTYGELAARAERLARRLAAAGVGAECRVGICLERGPRMVVAMLAILRAGGAYVPLDPGYPPERLAFMLADSGAAVVVAGGAARDALPPGVRVLDVDAEDAADAFPPIDPRAETGPEGLAYVIYTSGSTGTPKGVAVPHRAVVRLVIHSDYVVLTPDDRVGQASNASFDAATFEVWGALLNGGVLVGLAQDTVLSPPHLAAELAARGVTAMFLTTSLFNTVAREVPDAFRPLRTLMVGGEAADPGAMRRVLHAGPPERLLNVYGPTENTTFSTWHAVPQVAEDARSVPIGRTIAHSTARVLDSGLRPLPPGMPGELYVGGEGVARGYLGRPALTAERFRPDPLSPRSGARMYRTGDRVRWLDGGALEYLERLDAQVKIRGFRIEPGEVESAIARLPGVLEARVIVREDAPGEKRLVAYVVGEADADVLRARLRGSLPEYMLPAAFVPLDRLPLTPNGKLDVRALPAPDLAASADGYAAPQTPAEEALAEIWAELLHVERVGTADDFFALGGHSLLATRMISRIRERFAVDLPVRALFDGATVAELAARVEALGGAELPTSADEIHSPVDSLPQTGTAGEADRGDGIPLSFAQERLWFLDRMEPGSAFYNIPAARRLEGALDVPALERALGELVRRHEALRTTFAQAEGLPVQVIAPFAGFHLPVEAVPDAEEARRRASAEIMLPFDLAAGPLFRARLLRLGAEDLVLVVCLHHIVGDGLSLAVLFHELAALYDACREGSAPSLEPLPVQYADYALWEREEAHGQAVEAQLAYWREQLAGTPALLEVPADHPRPAVQSYRGAQERLDLPLELLERLRAVGRAESATPYMVLLAIFQLLLSRYTGSEDVVVGSPVAGRTRPEVQGVIGLFVNTLVLRTDLSGDPTFRELLRRVRAVALGAFRNQEVPFERLVEALRPERSLSHSPLIQVMFALDDVTDLEGRLSGLRVSRFAIDFPTAKFDLSLGFVIGPGRFGAALEYATDLFEARTAARMLRHVRRLLEQVAADPDLRLSALELADAAERRQVVEDWNRTDAELPAEPVHRLFELQTERTPDAPALVLAGAAIGYRALNERANRLAHHLVRLGVGTDSRVGICLERGPELVVAMLAVLKAGGAYVPLDPAYPAERLARMLADSAASVLVTEDALRDGFPAPEAVGIVRVDGDAARIAAESAANPARAVEMNALAYVIFTSGSTGTPKGVGIEHRSLANYVVHAAREFGLGPGDRLLQFHSPSFDPAAEEVFATLLSGAALVLRRGEALADPRELWNACRRESITVLDLPTAVWQSILPHLEENPSALVSSIRLAVTGGERMLPDALRVWRRVAPGVRLLNSYGPTETTVGATLWDTAEAGDDAHPAIPIGRPVPNTRAYVLDATLRPVPAGVPGELFVGGVQVARGYLGRPALTAERFVPDPFSAEPGARLYRTGDRVRWRHLPESADAHSRTHAPTHSRTAVLEYLGRADGQVKVRGFRIETGEIEAVLRRHPGVRECAVVAREHAPGDRRLVAYTAGEADAEALRAHLRAVLPDYMVPGTFVRLDALPLTPGGKVERRALPAPVADETRSLKPETETEARVAAVWEELLGIEGIGVEDNFFDLGGHSLLLVRVQARLEKELGSELSVVELFQYPTVRALAARLQGRSGAGAAVLGEERGAARQAALGRLGGRRRPGAQAPSF